MRALHTEAVRQHDPLGLGSGPLECRRPGWVANWMKWVRTHQASGSPVGLQGCQAHGEYHGLGRAGAGSVSGCTLESESSSVSFREPLPEPGVGPDPVGEGTARQAWH